MKFVQPILLYSWTGQYQNLLHYKSLPSVFYSLSGRLCDQDTNWEELALHTTNFTYVIASESPAFTPSCLADEHVRTLPNEPSNLVELAGFLAAKFGQVVRC